MAKTQPRPAGCHYRERSTTTAQHPRSPLADGEEQGRRRTDQAPGHAALLRQRSHRSGLHVVTVTVQRAPLPCQRHDAPQHLQASVAERREPDSKRHRGASRADGRRRFYGLYADFREVLGSDLRLSWISGVEATPQAGAPASSPSQLWVFCRSVVPGRRVRPYQGRRRWLNIKKPR